MFLKIGKEFCNNSPLLKTIHATIPSRKKTANKCNNKITMSVLCNTLSVPEYLRILS